MQTFSQFTIDKAHIPPLPSQIIICCFVLLLLFSLWEPREGTNLRLELEFCVLWIVKGIGNSLIDHDYLTCQKVSLSPLDFHLLREDDADFLGPKEVPFIPQDSLQWVTLRFPFNFPYTQWKQQTFLQEEQDKNLTHVQERGVAVGWSTTSKECAEDFAPFVELSPFRREERKHLYCYDYRSLFLAFSANLGWVLDVSPPRTTLLLSWKEWKERGVLMTTYQSENSCAAVPFSGTPLYNRISINIEHLEMQ